MNNLSGKRLYTFTIISNILSVLVGMIIGLVSVPISLNYWKVDRYGIWLLINSVLTYMSVSNLGLNSAASILINKNPIINEKILILKKSIYLTIINVVVLTIVFIFINFKFDNWIYVLGRIPTYLADESERSSFILILFFLVNVPFSLIISGLNGFHKVYITNVFQIIGTIVSLVVIIITIKINGNLIQYAIIVGIANFILNLARLAYFLIFIYFRIEKNKVNNDNNEENSYKSIFNLGLVCLSGSIASLVVLNTDNLVISHFIGVEMVSSYSITFKLFTILFSVIYVFNSSLIPLLGKKIGENKYEDIKDIYNKNVHLILYVGGGIWIAGVAFFKNLILLWVGVEGYAGFMTIFFLGAYSYVFSIVNLNYIMINTLNYLKGVVWIVWIEAIINFCASIILLKYFGLGGVALGTFLGTFLSPLFLFPFVLKRRSNNMIVLDVVYIIKHTLIVIPFLLVGILMHFVLNTFIINLFVTLILLSIYSILWYLMLPIRDKSNLRELVSGIIKLRSESNEK